ncbi:MAG TPA: efflux transporter periplasmic adaptor subunit, partial [Rhodospirillaceae bacterium]|nr:efflux transporter periplasmic adaptor subunit [Rhodospirillaceae bacterium]
AVGDKWLVAAGLEDGARVVIEGVQKIRPGAKVNPVAAGAPDAPAAEQAAPDHRPAPAQDKQEPQAQPAAAKQD